MTSDVNSQAQTPNQAYVLMNVILTVLNPFHTRPTLHYWQIPWLLIAQHF